MKLSLEKRSVLRNLSVTLIAALITACSGAPRQVEADVPLVAQTNKFDDANLVSSQYWNVLDDPSANYLSHPSYQIQIGPKYISALGLECRPLKIALSEVQLDNRVVCVQTHKDNKGKTIKAWYLTKSILQETQEIDI
ncbi:hypothetical protein L3Q72_23215 [Vibrio sp. JC009]|uniref:hypothetical protein n=1 Tax=Vibrio sp. JC009 TaxID=2912314 RepID=UPI0023AFC17B|nr:hypothetical protein [Vibrio sp. JC009]WED24143.1 hypothetical protein L3Q72_23215 [Vibrio sp. JC009]